MIFSENRYTLLRIMLYEPNRQSVISMTRSMKLRTFADSSREVG
jgi:hypothetical protein